jgi:hypothetical protein
MVPDLPRLSETSSESSSLVAVSAPAPDRFRLGDASLSLSGDEALLFRFRAILGDCAESAADRSLPLVHCQVDDDGHSDVAVSFLYPGAPLDLHGFVAGLAAYAGTLRDGSGDTLRFDRQTEWRGAVANCAIQATLAIQPGALFFHAASVDVAGRGILIAGPKNTGKSTTSLALAARGHRLLGDEIAAVRTQTSELLPFPRAVSLRDGVRSELLDERLRGTPSLEETYPDGSRRLRIKVSDLFDRVEPQAVPLAALFFLKPFGEATRIERFLPSLDQVSLLEPLGSALWGDSGGRRRFQLLRLLSTVACYDIAPGPPDETADRIEKLMEG